MRGFNEYECGLTGVTSEAGHFEEEDGLADLPIGWPQITIQRRTLNPEWVIMNRLKAVTKAQMMSAIPEDEREAQEPYVDFQLKMAFESVESKTPRYILDIDDVVHLSPEKEVLEAFNEMREMLGLEPAEEPPIKVDEDDEEEEDEDEEDDE